MCLIPCNPILSYFKSCNSLWNSSELTRSSGLTLHFDELSVLSLPKEAVLLHPAFSKVELSAAEWVNFLNRYLSYEISDPEVTG